MKELKDTVFKPSSIERAFKSLRVWLGTTGVSILVGIVSLQEQSLQMLSLMMSTSTAESTIKILAYIVGIGTVTGLIHGANRSKSNISLDDRV